MADGSGHARGADEAKLWSMVRDIRIAMLTSEDSSGGETVLRSRQMAVAQNEFDGALWFFTSVDSHKVADVRQDTRVCLSYADPQAQNYVSVSGHARLVRDRAAIDAHWSESARVWFPKGKDDPSIALLCVDVTQAEYWDAPSSTMLHLYGYVKARLTGEPPHPGGHAKVELA
jgi:general stress protein 26